MKKTIILIVTLICVIALGVVGFMIYTKGNQTKAENHVDTAKQYIDDLDYEQAIAELELAIKIDPKCESAYLTLANVYVSMGNYDDAIDVLKKGYEETESKRLKKKLDKVKEEEKTQSDIQTPGTPADPGTSVNPETPADSGDTGVIAPPEPEPEPETPDYMLLDDTEMINYVINGEEYFMEEEDFLVHAQNQKVTLTPDEAQKYPALDQALQDFYSKSGKSAEETAAALYDMIAENADYYSWHVEMEDMTAYEVVRGDAAIFSMEQNSYGYWGGAHGYGESIGINFDPETGRRLALKDILRDDSAMDEVYDLVCASVKDQYGDSYSEINMDSAYQLMQSDYVNWSITYDTLSIWFNAYELSYYAMGAQYIEIPLADHKELFKEKYLELPEEFCVPYDSVAGCRFDWNGDGTADYFDVSYERTPQEDSEWGECTFNIILNDKQSRHILRGDSYQSYVMKTRDSYYLLLMLWKENGDSYMVVNGYSDGDITGVAYIDWRPPVQTTMSEVYVNDVAYTKTEKVIRCFTSIQEYVRQNN